MGLSALFYAWQAPAKAPAVLPREGEIWLCNLGRLRKRRPVVVLRREEENPYLKGMLRFVVASLTTKDRGPSWTPVELPAGSFGLIKSSYISARSQLSVPAWRFVRPIGALSDETLQRVRKASGKVEVYL